MVPPTGGAFALIMSGVLIPSSLGRFWRYGLSAGGLKG
ncbi:hypothetical protein ABH941_001497 [Streptacidiphilus sp. EB103A]